MLRAHHDQQATSATKYSAFALLSLLLRLLTCRVPFRSGGHRGETPEGRRTWMCAVRGRGRMPLPRIPVMDADPERVSAEGARQGALSFGYFSLREQRKVTRPKGRKPLLLLDFACRTSGTCRSGFSRDRALPGKRGRGRSRSYKGRYRGTARRSTPAAPIALPRHLSPATPAPPAPARPALRHCRHRRAGAVPAAPAPRTGSRCR